ncbi:DUF885 domain-containing protein [Ekhidna sp.]|uniref:DUF885 domain-containing protein n=1 Tax=Ekhidna sp. TaxID=2608089 RepID=UPI003CCBFA87
MKYFLFLILLLFTSSSFAQSDKKLNDLIKEIDSINEQFSIENSIWKGKHPESFQFQTTDQKLKQVEQLKPYLSALEKLDKNDLTSQGHINRMVKVLQLRNQISEIDYKIYLIPFNAEGGFFNRPSFFLPNLPFKTKEDYEAYLKWLPSFATYISYNQGLLEQGVKEKIQAPKVIVLNILSLLEPWTGAEISSNPFYAPFMSMPASISEQDQLDLKEKAAKIIGTDILPVYQQLSEFLNDEYLPKAPEKVGISEIKNGRSYFENRVKHFTTLEITPDSVYATGLAEVARIRASMDAILQEVGFDGSFEEFLAFLRTDEQFYPTSPQELLNYAAWLSKKAEGQLPRLFSKLYELPFTVEPVPDDIAPKYTAGRYVGGSKEQGRPGIYWVNTYDLKSRTLYTLPALTLHEAVPGHHLQNAIAAELEDVPEFRRNYYISAFGEGWGLYSEYLGEEMGMYATPYDLFGRYTYEMWRACRLVVDVGLHYKGWTRQEAVDYMASNTALSLHEVNTEIDRYIGWPGQAVSYKMGELMIKKLRNDASVALGEDFDIQEFHYHVLKNGSIPLPILESEIKHYIDAKKAE